MFRGKNQGPGVAAQSAFGGAATIIWEDAYKGPNVMWRVPRNIRLNDNVVVREDEFAIFMRDGKVLMYIDRPDRYALTSMNAPIVGKLVTALSGVQQQAEVYYVQRRIFDGKFGSKEPFQFRDPDFGIVSLRTFGDFRWRVSHPDNFISQFVGTFGAQGQADVEDRLRDQLVLLTYNTLGQMKEQGMRVTDIAAQLSTMEQMILGKAPDFFDAYGIEINRIQGLSVNLPEDVQRAVETRSSMGVLGVNYMQYQAGQAMVDAAKNPGTAGAGVGLGMGMGAGMGMGYGMYNTMAPGMQPGAGQGGGPSSPCPKCGSLVPSGLRFCPSCGTPLSGAQQTAAPAQGVTCPKCGEAAAPGVKFCPNCGASMVTPPPRTCPKCNQPIAASMKFCANCGAPAPP